MAHRSTSLEEECFQKLCSTSIHLFYMAKHGQCWQLDHYVRGNTPERQENATAQCLPHTAALLRRMPFYALSIPAQTSSLTPLISPTGEQTSFFITLWLKAPLKIKDLLRGHYPSKYLHFLSRAKAITEFKTPAPHTQLPNFHVYKSILLTLPVSAQAVLRGNSHPKHLR